MVVAGAEATVAEDGVDGGADGSSAGPVMSLQ
jgi:hypothetical protein